MGCLSAYTYNINTSVVRVRGNFMMNFITIGGILKPWVGEQNPIRVGLDKSGGSISSNLSMLISRVVSPFSSACLIIHLAAFFALPVPEK